MIQTQPSAKALLPLLVFLALFIGTGTWLTLQGVEFAFYQLPAPVAALPAVMLALMLGKEGFNKNLETFFKGVGHSNIMAMCLIYLLAGAFASVAKATGGVDATVALGLSLIPGWFLLPGLFLISAFIATAMGTSMGTIGAVAPVALGVAQAAGIDPVLMAGTILSGAMFGDNLSIISDTTIAATRSQGCEMKDKFRENVKIAAPAAIGVILLYLTLGSVGEAPASNTAIELFKVMPYLLILGLALAGVNVFVVLGIGILAAGLVGLFNGYELGQFSKDIYQGFTGMQEIFLLSMLIGGLGALMERQGGLAWISTRIAALIARFTREHSGEQNEKAAELGIAGVVGLTNLCTANNTVAIIVASKVARDLAEHHGVTPRRAASMLDIFSCVVQGLIPWGAQALLLGSIFALSPLSVVSMSFYPMALALAALAAVFIKHQMRQR
ncbi:Na+/H+ antiporter NhaC family protein [Aeromonas enteropelogenes]|uniref:Na+/H+ antiporter NhaC family protein n=1 Tax=Aeromonas sp. 19NY04SH05-1 TaxID=2920537 RepID=A0AAU6T4H6_9GAMM|nr:Na+/H+ antiporter NhaC family protein [Aeromonas enteropelogenes]MCZ0752805.1 Na+/H+ antiporter NhaC family protein [Aeromonas enteropelogenes]UBH56504.1 Na+/H+ antiporter NhaC family protein [Aeromonas enteropelogenes]BEE18196.1 sodium:proton antiporter [Aeromonas enteropelogenes]BEE22359.1 sodium:proton antiporter [Aeromonas enteropelogenes]